jgi:hypothetical protein
MSSRIVVSVAMATMSLIFAVGCTHDAKKKTEIHPLQKSVSQKENIDLTPVKFEGHRAELDNLNKRYIEALTKEAVSDGRPVKEIQILSWAESKQARDLAARRYRVIENYLAELNFSRPTLFKNLAETTKKNSSRQEKAFAELLQRSDVAAQALIVVTYKDSRTIN